MRLIGQPRRWVAASKEDTPWRSHSEWNEVVRPQGETIWEHRSARWLHARSDRVSTRRARPVAARGTGHHTGRNGCANAYNAISHRASRERRNPPNAEYPRAFQRGAWFEA